MLMKQVLNLLFEMYMCLETKQQEIQKGLHL